MPHAVPEIIELIRDPYSLWLGATSLLSMIVVFLLWRMTIRRKPTT